METTTSKITMPVIRQRATEHLCGELLRYSDLAGSIAADMGEAGVRRYDDQQVEISGHTLNYNVTIRLHSLIWESGETGESGIAVMGYMYLGSVNYDVSIDGVSIWDNETGEDVSVPEGLLKFLRDGLSGTWESEF